MTKEDEARIRGQATYWERLLLAEIDRLRTMSIVEMMCENERVSQHVTEWERRCLKAEARVEELEALLADPDPAIMPTPKRNP